MLFYKTVSEDSEIELIVERSKFIAATHPIETREEGEIFIAQRRKLYRDATHNVPAIVVGNKFQIQWTSDDGEPQGTSGPPILNMLVKKGITNVVVVVTRYFGGVKLGTGGLVKAYTNAAQEAIEAAGIVQVERVFQINISMDYSDYNLLMKINNHGLLKIISSAFAERVDLDIEVPFEEKEFTLKRIKDLTKGKVKINSMKEGVTQNLA